MSTGHMSRPELILTYVGSIVVGGGTGVIGMGYLGGEAGNPLGLLYLGVSLPLFFVAKVWLWKHTIYPDGWSSATFVWNPEDYPEEMRRGR